MQTKIGSRVFGSLALAAVLAVPAATFAQGNKAVSDAQVEANVLKAFASDDRLSNQPINTSTVYGTVTLTGSVANDAARDAAEQIASRTSGVKKVVDQLTVGAAPGLASDYDPASQNSLPSNGSAVPAAQGSAIASAQAQTPESGNQPPAYAQAAPAQQNYPQQQGQYQQQQGQYQQQGYPPQGAYGQPQGGDPAYAQQGQYPAQQSGYPQGGQYPQNSDPRAQGNYPPPPPNGRLYRRDYERQMAAQQGYAQAGRSQGQPGGQLVVLSEWRRAFCAHQPLAFQRRCCARIDI